MKLLLALYVASVFHQPLFACPRPFTIIDPFVGEVEYIGNEQYITDKKTGKIYRVLVDNWSNRKVIDIIKTWETYRVK